MRKVSFPFTVRHGGVKYPAGTPVEVDENEVSDMLAMGAMVLEEKTPKKPEEFAAADEKVMAEATEKAVKTEKSGTGNARKNVSDSTSEDIAGQENLFEQPEKPKRKRKPKEE